MSVKLMALVLDLPFKPKHKLIMVVLSNYANDDGENVYPSLSTMQRKTSLTRPAVVSGIKDLLEDKILILESKGSVTRKSSRYHIAVQILNDLTSKPDLLVNGVYQSLVNGVSSTSKRRLPDPLLNDHDHGWMKEDSICLFLGGLPGFNPDMVLEVRKEILSHHYDPNELPYLWNECAQGDNPAGLFVHKVRGGHHSIDWQMRVMQQEAEAERRQLAEVDQDRVQKAIAQREAGRPAPVVPDETVKPDQIERWSEVVSELCFNLDKNTIRSYVAGNALLSCNGSWTVAVSHPEWWQIHDTSIKRIYKKIVGMPMSFTYVKAG